MKIFIWENLENLTNNWHPEGGLIIVAESIEIAREMYIPKNNMGEKIKCDYKTKEPTAIYETSQAEPRVFVFPNAGCC